MKIKSKELIEWFKTDEITEEFIGKDEDLDIWLSNIDFQSKETINIFAEIRQLQSLCKTTKNFNLAIDGIKSGKDIDLLLLNLNNCQTSNCKLNSLWIEGNLDNADFSKISNLKTLRDLSIHHNGENGRANIKTIKLPPNIDELILWDISKNCEVDVSNLSEVSKEKLTRLDLGTALDSNITKITSIKDLSVEQAIELKKRNNNAKVQIFAKAYDSNYRPGFWQQDAYDIDTYIAVRTKLDELVENIDMNMDEEEKFANIYTRICKNIVYDRPAAYPKNDAEKEYSKENIFKCRDLRNGLLEGKCVCAGYADILRSALELVGIEACYISGPLVGERKIQNQIINKYNTLDEDSHLRKVFKNQIEKLKKPKIEHHGWVKLKLNGKWYNADPTWDTMNIRNGYEPTHALKTDEECKLEEKYDNPGPECTTKFSPQRLNRIFGHSNLFIGDEKIPNLEDIKNDVKIIKKNPLYIPYYALWYLGLGIYIPAKGVLSAFNTIKNRILLHSKDRKALPPVNMDKEYKTEQKSQEEELKSWDLKRWGIEQIKPQEIQKDKENIKSNILSPKTLEDNLDIDER